MFLKTKMSCIRNSKFNCVLLVFVCLCIPQIFVYVSFKHWQNKYITIPPLENPYLYTPGDTEGHQLIIGVLSARYHFEKRSVLREYVYKPKVPGILYLFIIGNQSLSEDNTLEQNQLEEEQKQHGDILFLDMIDTYRNLPLKVILFFEWVTMMTRFEYAMKTDDDTFVNLQQFSQNLRDVHRTRIWWGHFRPSTWWGNHVTVSRTGKWAVSEEDFSRSTYPSYAAGAGSILSADIVTWLVGSFEDGILDFVVPWEDALMGLWLEHAAIDHIHDKRFTLFKHCRDDLFVKPQLSVAELQQYGTNVEACGLPCGC